MLRGLSSAVLCVLLLAVQWPSVCWARSEQTGGCAFDRIAKESGPLPTVIIKDTPKHSNGKTFQAYTVSTGDAWRLMRIQTSIEPFRSKDLACEKWSSGPNVNNMFKQSVPCVQGYAVPKAAEYIAGEVLDRAIKLHTDRLLVQPLSGKIKVPKFESDNFCSHFQVPEAHQSIGFSDADMMLYAAVSPLGKRGVFSAAAPCATITDGGRPVVGGFVFDTAHLSVERQRVRIAAHDIAHALGFSYSNMRAKGMTTTMNVRDNKRIVVNSTNVKQAVKAHYGCENISRMELENGEAGSADNENAEMLSHWERRNAKDELMAYPLTQRGDAFAGLYTALTLSAFEDLGYYKAKYDMAEPMTWGHKAGCEFLKYKCANDKKEDKLPAMFCKSETKENFVCTSDRQEIGKCTLSDHFERNYSALGRSVFGGALPLGSGDAARRDDFLTDFCPVVSSMTSCNEKYYEPGTLLESHAGAQALCLDGESLKEKIDDKKEKDIYAICAEIRCENKTVTVRFKDEKNAVVCPEGESITPKFAKYKSGKVTCPKYDEVCTISEYGKSLVTPDASKVSDLKQTKESEETTEAKAIPKKSDAKPSEQPNTAR